MYSCKFISENGTVFLLDTTNNIVFDIDGLSGISVNHTMSQGALQIGESISTKSVGSKSLAVTGVIFKNIAETKKQMRRVFAPFATGKLIFNNEYFINVSVKDAPTFSPIANRGNFTMRLLAPYPFFKKMETKTSLIGGVVKKFRFPINYSTPHKFAERSNIRYINVYNDSDVETDFNLSIQTDSVSNNPYITNLNTFETLKINRTIYQGEKIEVYRNADGVLEVVLIDENGNAENIFADLDEKSDLFVMHVGDNLILSSDDDGGTTLTTYITFNEIVVGVFDES